MSGYRGRYSSYDEGERNPIVRFLAARSWFLIIPLIGLVYANAKQITPKYQQIKARIVTEEAAINQERVTVLKGAREMESHISQLHALQDTFAVRFAKVDSLADSVSVLLSADRQATGKLQAELDSLRQVYSLAMGQSQANSESLQVLSPIVDSLKTAIATRTAEAQGLDEETATNLDLADRVLNPIKYRKNTALVTGKGDFPNRDALPKR
jgi:chromosome segregation ATPase